MKFQGSNIQYSLKKQFIVFSKRLVAYLHKALIVDLLKGTIVETHTN